MLLQTALFDISAVSNRIADGFARSKTGINHDFLIAALQNCMLESIRTSDQK